MRTLRPFDMAAPAQLLVVGSLQQVEDASSGGQGPDSLRFQLRRTMSLSNAVKLKARTRAGKAGYVLVNPELLECKFLTKLYLEDGYERLLAINKDRFNQDILPLKADIAKLESNLEIPDTEMVHVGPPVDQRNQGVQQVIYPRPRFPEHPAFEHYLPGPESELPFTNPLVHMADKDAAVERDRQAQKKYWQINLAFLKKKLDVLEQMQVKLERELKEIYIKGIDEPCDETGVGYCAPAFLLGTREPQGG